MLDHQSGAERSDDDAGREVGAFDQETNESSQASQMEYTGAQEAYSRRASRPAWGVNDGRPLLALLSFGAALLCLGLLLGHPFNMLIGMLLLICAVLLVMAGLVLLERSHAARVSQRRAPQGFMDEDQDEEEEAIEPEQEDDAQELTPFELLVREALDSIPQEFQERMENLVVLIEDEPDEETLRRVGTREGSILLGLYEGRPLIAQSYMGAPLPERITIYRRSIEAYCGDDPERIRAQVRATVLHEVAHHFGLEHEEMPIWVK